MRPEAGGVGRGHESPAHLASYKVPRMSLSSLAGCCRRTSVQAVTVLIVTAVYLGYFQFLTPFIVETDGYFHIKVAWLLRTRGVLHDFPWTAFSLWSEHYFDKEWLYHEMLSLFTFGDLVKGAKVAAVVFGTAIFVSFYLVLRWSGIRTAIFWTLLMLVGSGGYFGWRVCLTRPHVWSITLSLWAMYFVLRAAPYRLFATSAVYALSYTAPHVAIGYAAINAAARRLLDRRWALRIPMAALFGVAAGWLIHPQRRNAFTAVWTQTVQVLLSNKQYDTPNLHLGGELSPAPWDSFLREHAALFVVVAVAVLVYWRLRPRVTSANATLMITSLVWLVMTLMSKRFVEYWVPFTFWACASVIDPLLERFFTEAVPRAKEEEWPRALVWVALGISLGLVGEHTWLENMNNYRGPRASGAEPAALWLRSHTPENSIVFTCDWDDAPELLFYDARNRYLVAMDPNFMYRWRPDIWKIWNEVANGGSSKPADMITGTFGANYGFCTSDFGALKAQLLRDARVKVHDFGGNGYVFEIAAASPGPAAFAKPPGGS